MLNYRQTKLVVQKDTFNEKLNFHIRKERFQLMRNKTRCQSGYVQHVVKVDTFNEKLIKLSHPFNETKLSHRKETSFLHKLSHRKETSFLHTFMYGKHV